MKPGTQFGGQQSPGDTLRALGAVTGIVGAGGNAGAVLAGFLFASTHFAKPQAFLILGLVVAFSSVLALTLGSTKAEVESAVLEDQEAAMAV